MFIDIFKFFIYFIDILVFDNLFSWIRSKIIYYNVEVLCEDEVLIIMEINSLIEQGDWEIFFWKFEIMYL